MKRYLLIDYYNLFIRNFNVVPITNEDGDHFGGTFGFLRGVKSAIDMFDPTDVIVVTDGPNASLRRKMVEREYKANRKKTWKRGIVKAYDFLNEQEHKDNFNMQIARTNQYLEVLPIKYVSVPYVEADDIIAEIANTVDDQCVIYSTDADYKQLVNERVICYNPMAKQTTNRKTFMSKFGFLPENFIYYKMITGDKSDGLPGVPGIGPKTFIKLFPTTKDSIFESTKDLLDYSEFVVGSKSDSFTKAIKAKHQMILDSSEVIHKNWNLMQLQDVDVSAQTKDFVRTLVGREPNEFNRMKLRLMFMEDKLQSQVKNFNDWSRVFSRLMIKGK